jgi:spoIIIJ-associated protein
VEWVEVAGKTIAEATELALDQLGVAEGDAEVIVITEPKAGLFGRMRGEARVKVRVRPVGARPKRERSRDRSRGGKSGGQGSNGPGGRPATPRDETSSPSSSTSTATATSSSNGSTEGTGGGTSRSARRRRNRSQAANGAASNGGTRTASSSSRTDSNGSADKSTQRIREPKETAAMAEGMTLEEQGEVGRAFLAGLLTEYGVSASVEMRLLDEETVEIAAMGEDLGLLVGPRGSTLSALQDLTRAVVQRQCPSRTDRILVDVAGYREKRSAALKRFSMQIAEEVIASGQEKALEAMSPADRKAVHDAVNEIDGVATRSEGEDPNRYIVIAPAG